MNTSKLTSRRHTDVIAVACPSAVRLLRANGAGIRPQLSLPVGPKTRSIDISRALLPALRGSDPRRLLLSVIRGTPYSAVVEPLVDVLSMCAQLERCPLIWLPDIGELFQAAHLPTSGSSGLGSPRGTPRHPLKGGTILERLRALRKRAQAGHLPEGRALGL